MFLHEDRELFLDVISATANDIQTSLPIIEKDYYVTMILKLLSKKAPECVFKGGTSLSKCHHVIDRFSEDIDIAFTEKLGRGPRKQFKEHVIADISTELNMPIADWDKKWSKSDYNCYVFGYNPLDDFVPESLFQGVKTEVVLSSLSFPTEKKTVDSYVYQFLKKENMEIVTEFGLEPFEMNVQILDRTFIDKVFALCDYYIDNDLKLHSRHIYDIYMLLPMMKFDLHFKDLVKIVREHRQSMSICRSASPENDIPKLLSKIVEGEVYKKDYEEITDYFQKTKIDYETAITAITKVAESGMF